MENKEYPSVFLAGEKVDESNYICELVIANFLKWQRRPLPQQPFWRKSSTELSPALKELGKRYQVELSAIKNLLKIFTAHSLISVFKSTGTVGIKMIKKENQQRLIFLIYEEELKHLKSIENIIPVDNKLEGLEYSRKAGKQLKGLE